MKKYFILICFVNLFINFSQNAVAFSPKPIEKLTHSRNQYPNLLILDSKSTFFADLGAWHAYSVPASNEEAGGFAGPFLLDSNKFCVSKRYLQFTPVIGNDTLVPAKLDAVKCTYYPGRVEQEYTLKGMHFEHTVEFIDNRSALIRYTIKNTSDQSKDISLLWQGKLDGGLQFSQGSKNLELITKLKADGKRLITHPVGTFEGTLVLAQNQKSFCMALNNSIRINPGEEKEFFFRQTYFIDQNDAEKHPTYSTDAPSTIYSNNSKRWNSYISKTLNSDSKWLKEEKYRRVAVKAIMTLIVNWRSAAGDLLHDGITPSINLYDGFWAWDSWKHAAACAIFNPELGKSNIKAMFDYQDDFGMVADCIYVGKSENNWRDTKPPLAAWAVWEIFKTDPDTAFLNEIFPKLIKYHEWWYKYRDNDKNGLCEFGSTDGSRQAAAWESGMDNAVRYDSALMVKNAEGAWSLDQESVDLNSFLYKEKIILAEIMELLFDPRAKEYREAASELKKRINTLMYSKEKGFYFDIKLQGKKQLTLMGSEGWHPLWAGLAQKEQAKQVVIVMSDPSKFNTFIPLPTFQADHPAFDPEKGYWRGPIWLDQVYFGIAGLQNYGYTKLADGMFVKTMTNAEGMLGSGPFCENYNPITGKGIQVKNFSWAAAHTLLLICGK